MSKGPSEQRTRLDYISHPPAMFGGLTSTQVLRPLWLVFAGGLIYWVTLGVVINSRGQNNWILHLSDQPIGALLIAVGVWRLGKVDIDREYMVLMRFILIVTILQVISTTATFFPVPRDPLIDLSRAVLGLASTAALLGFCTAMRWFCQDLGLQRSARGWIKTTIVFACACVPLALFQFLGLLVVLKVAQVNPSSVNGHNALGQDAAGWFLVSILLILAPALAFLLSILQMRGQMIRREAV